MTKIKDENRLFELLTEDIFKSGYKSCYNEKESKELNKKIALLVKLTVKEINESGVNYKLENLLGRIRVTDAKVKKMEKTATSITEQAYVQSVNEVEQRIVRELAASLGKVDKSKFVGVDNTVMQVRKELASYALCSSNMFDQYIFSYKNPELEAEKFGSALAQKSTVLLAYFLRDCEPGANREELLKIVKASKNEKVQRVVKDIENKRLQKLVKSVFGTASVMQ